MYDSRAEAEYARERLVSECGAKSTRILAKDTAAALDGLQFAKADAETYRDGLMKGGHLLVTDVPDGTGAKRVVDLLKSAMGRADVAPDVQVPDDEGVRVDIEPDVRAAAPVKEETAAAPRRADQLADVEADVPPPPMLDGAPSRSAEFAQPQAETAPAMAAPEPPVPAAPEPPTAGDAQVLPRGSRVRPVTREAPAEEQIMLRRDSVDVEQRQSDHRLSPEEVEAAGLFRERIVEIAEMREEPVVTKFAVVREEIIVRKTVEEREETIRETVRHTALEVDDLAPTGSRNG